MTSYSRKRFLALSAGAVLTQAPLARAATQFLEHADAALLPRPGRSGIEHVVVVMMENRSFDHLLGWLPHADGKQSGLKYVDQNGHTQSTYRLAPDFQGCGHVDPDHSYDGGRVQYNGGKCDGFLRTNGGDRLAIGYYTGADLPFLGHAARDWTTCDRYFAAIMSSTWANRAYEHAGVTPALTDPHVTLRLPTIWDRLAAKGLRGRSYYSTGEPFLENWGNKYKSIIQPYHAFLDDCRRGSLPHVSYVDPPRKGDQEGLSSDYHPFGDVRAGESFLNETYQAVTKSKNWGSTVMVISFDEWGGFFDHVRPPLAPDVSAGLQLRGFRVPCLVVSPFARRRHVAHTVFDHTSILRMIEWRWGLRPLSVRDRHANNLATVLDFRHKNMRVPQYKVPKVVSKPCK
ncbi:MAG: phospholipase [Gaiellaceae bacterium]|nr:phospholipase [Gaiellaceae bacterium]